MLRFITVFFCFMLPGLSIAQLQAVSVPLEIPMSYVRQLAYQSIGFNDKGEVEIADEKCSVVKLNQPKLWVENDLLNLVTDIKAEVGLSLLGGCFDLKPFNGQLRINLEPSILRKPPTILFTTQSSNITMDGDQKTIIDSVIKLILEKQLLPRLQAFQIDIAAALEDLNQSIDLWLSHSDNTAPRLVERSYLSNIHLKQRKIEVDITFSLNVMNEEEKEPPLNQEEMQAWQTVEDEIDGFMTYIVLHLLESNKDKLAQSELIEILMDTRFAIANILAQEVDDQGVYIDQDPVRRLFINAWDRLRPFLKDFSEKNINTTNSYQFLGFIAGGDALKTLDKLGPEYGIEITRDGLRRLARLILGGDAPTSFTPLPLGINPIIQEYFNIDSSFNEPADNDQSDGNVSESIDNKPIDNSPSAPQSTLIPLAPEQSLVPEPLQSIPLDTPEDQGTPTDDLDKDKLDNESLDKESPIQNERHELRPTPKRNDDKSLTWVDYIIHPAFASTVKFRGLVKDSDNVSSYINEANRFIDEQTIDFFKQKNRVPDQFSDDFKIMMKATAWKESCWRQFSGSSDSPRTITSSVGAVGMMQINARVWRGIYDIDQLKNDVSYNFRAGTKILEHYFIDYALKKGEDKKGNPFQATYATYNGGPAHLTRYRKETSSDRLKAIDKAFLKAFESIEKTNKPNIDACYSV